MKSLSFFAMTEVSKNVMLPVWDVLEAAPHDLAAHREVGEVELVVELKAVGELLDIEHDAILGSARVWVALSIPGSIERQQVDPQLLCQLLHICVTSLNSILKGQSNTYSDP
jgi:hypothetical protein